MTARTPKAAATTLMAMAAMVAVAGCAKKKPAQLPPPPPSSNTPMPQDNAPPQGAIGNGIVPGSRADFIQQAGTDTIHFDTDSSSINGEAGGILAAQAHWLTQHPNVPVTIEGHCDERGTREYNLALGERRANAAKDYLVSQGVAPARISTISYGKERPIAMGDTEDAWAQNRRAVTVVPQ